VSLERVCYGMLLRRLSVRNPFGTSISLVLLEGASRWCSYGIVLRRLSGSASVVPLPFPFRSLVAACAPRIYDEGHSVVPIEAFPIVASPSPAYRAARQGPSKPSKVRSTRAYHRKEGGTRKRSYQRLLPSEAERRHRSVPFPLLGLRNARRNPKGRQGALPLRMPRGFGTERLRTVSGSKGFPHARNVPWFLGRNRTRRKAMGLRNPYGTKHPSIPP